MKFGPMPLMQVRGAILAHSVIVGGKRLRKGRVLSDQDIELLESAGHSRVTVASLERQDIDEDQAAQRVATALVSTSGDLTVSAPFTGRANIFSDVSGVFEVDGEAVARLNQIDPSITLATLPNLAHVVPRMMVGTVKIVTYGVPEAHAIAAEKAAVGVLSVRSIVHADAGLVVTKVEGQPTRLVEKGLAAVRQRLDRLGIRLADSRIVHHTPEAVGEALSSCDGSLLLILTGSATSDPKDVGPEGLRLAGGELHRFGIPVDPGNLLFYGELGMRPVVGLPGCARSPALNGADWVLERISCGIALGDPDFAAMGVGGLLKEISVRPHPRARAVAGPLHPKVSAVLVADGPDGLEDAIGSLLDSKVEKTIVVGTEAVRKLIPESADSRIQFVAVQTLSSALGDALGSGVRTLPEDADAVILSRSGTRVPTVLQLNRMIAAYSPDDGREICRLTGLEGLKGPPLLFGRRFFEALAGLAGTRGAADLVAEAGDYVVDLSP